MQIYSVPYFTDSQDFLLHVARQRGKLKKVSGYEQMMRISILDLFEMIYRIKVPDAHIITNIRKEFLIFLGPRS
jgi:hypothetical protein